MTHRAGEFSEEFSKQDRSRATGQLRVEAAAARRRQRNLRVLAVAVAFVLVAAAIGLTVVLTRPEPMAPRPASVTSPGGGIVVGGPSAPVVVDVWEDFQSPASAAAHETLGPVLAELTDTGAARVVYHPLPLLGPGSQRAANAFGCAADAGRSADYHDTLFANQPAPGSGGFTAEELVALGEGIGLRGDEAAAEFAACVRGGTYAQWVEQVAASRDDAGVAETPTIFVDGEELPRAAPTAAAPGGYAADALRAAVGAAR